MVVQANGEPDLSRWLARLKAANILQPASYSLKAIADLFYFPTLFNGAFNSSVLNQAPVALEEYIVRCAPDNRSGFECNTYSPACASQTYNAGGNNCMSCFTSGPRCSGLANRGVNFAGCTSSECFCNAPWSGAQCNAPNVGTCYASRGVGGQRCGVYKNCCPPGWGTDATTRGGGKNKRNVGKCGCRCTPPSGGSNGFNQAGCGNNINQYCGDCPDCTNSQGNGPYACRG